MDNHPYIFVLTYSKNGIIESFRSIIFSRLIEFSSISFAMALLLLLIYRENKQAQKILELKYIAERANEAKTEFLIKSTNQFRNFVHGIQGCAEIIKSDLRERTIRLKSKENPQNQKEIDELETVCDLSHNIIEASHDLNNFINDLLDLNRNEIGEFKITKSHLPVNLEKIIKQAVTLSKKTAETADVILIAKIEPNLQKPTELDKHRVKQVLLNLIANAIKHSHKGSVVEILARNIVDPLETRELLKLGRIKKTPPIEIIVKDYGFGIGERQLKKSLQKNNAENANNIDLGLPIAKFLIEKQGGIFEIKSERNKGSEVRIIL